MPCTEPQSLAIVGHHGQHSVARTSASLRNLRIRACRIQRSGGALPAACHPRNGDSDGLDLAASLRGGGQPCPDWRIGSVGHSPWASRSRSHTCEVCLGSTAEYRGRNDRACGRNVSRSADPGIEAASRDSFQTTGGAQTAGQLSRGRSVACGGDGAAYQFRESKGHPRCRPRRGRPCGRIWDRCQQGQTTDHGIQSEWSVLTSQRETDQKSLPSLHSWRFVRSRGK